MNELSATTIIEKKIVRHIIRELRAAGYEPTLVWDGGEYVKATTEQAVMDAVFAVDDATVHFDGGKGDNEHSHGVYFVLGNGIDVYSDSHCGDPEFAAVLERCVTWINELDG
jgi:hypothetical protein